MTRPRLARCGTAHHDVTQVPARPGTAWYDKFNGNAGRFAGRDLHGRPGELDPGRRYSPARAAAEPLDTHADRFCLSPGVNDVQRKRIPLSAVRHAPETHGTGLHAHPDTRVRRLGETCERYQGDGDRKRYRQQSPQVHQRPQCCTYSHHHRADGTRQPIRSVPVHDVAGRRSGRHNVRRKSPRPATRGSRRARGNPPAAAIIMVPFLPRPGMGPRQDYRVWGRPAVSWPDLARKAIRPASASHSWELPSIACTQGYQDVPAGLGRGLVPEAFAGVQRDVGPVGMWGGSWKPG